MRPDTISAIPIPKDMREYIDNVYRCPACDNKCSIDFHEDAALKIDDQIEVFCSCQNEDHEMISNICKNNNGGIFITSETLNFAHEDYIFVLKFDHYPDFINLEIERKHMYTGVVQEKTLTESIGFKLRPFSPKRLANMIENVIMLA